MNNTLRPSISSKEITQLLQSQGFEVKQTGGHVLVIASNGTVSFPVDRELSPFMVATIRKSLNQCKIMSNREFDKFISEKSPIMGRVVERVEKKFPNTPLYTNVKDETLKKCLMKLGSPPMDTLIREAGVVLEDRLRHIARETGTILYGVALIDEILTPGKEKIKFSAHPGEQDGVRMLYRGAMQFIRNPAMHKLIDYPESEARIFIQILDSLLQLLSEGEYIEES